MAESTERTKAAKLGTWGRWALFWTLFVGLGALLGWGMMLFAPEFFGMTPLLAEMQGLPFADVFFTSLVWPAFFLLIFNGLTQLTAAGLILARHRLACWAVLGCAVILLGWIGLQFVIFALNPITTVYGLFALAELVSALLWRRSLKAQHPR